MAAITGELTFASVPALLERAQTLVADGRVDLSGVTKADSAGLALLLELTRRAKGQVSFGAPPAQVRDLIRFFDLESALKLEGGA